MTGNNHSKYHSRDAFCGNAGPEEMAHLNDLIEKLTDDELKLLVKRIGIEFLVEEDKLNREDYERVIDEADREDFYREYKKIIELRKTAHKKQNLL
jgi:hypothetical protein